MKKINLLILVLVLMPIAVSAASLQEILTKPDSFDKSQVVVEAEVIGEALNGDGGSWLNISSGDNSLGVFTQSPRSLRAISHWGGYLETGDYVKISGEFYKQCPLHQTSDIHLESLEVLKKGHKNQPRVSLRKVRIANLGLVFCLIAAAIYFIKEKYARKT